MQLHFVTIETDRLLGCKRRIVLQELHTGTHGFFVDFLRLAAVGADFLEEHAHLLARSSQAQCLADHRGAAIT